MTPLALSQKQAALREKELGNECYKNKQLEEALAHYSKAMELDPKARRRWLSPIPVPMCSPSLAGAGDILPHKPGGGSV